MLDYFPFVLPTAELILTCKMRTYILRIIQELYKAQNVKIVGIARLGNQSMILLKKIA